MHHCQYYRQRCLQRLISRGSRPRTRPSRSTPPPPPRPRRGGGRGRAARCRCPRPRCQWQCRARRRPRRLSHCRSRRRMSSTASCWPGGSCPPPHHRTRHGHQQPAVCWGPRSDRTHQQKCSASERGTMESCSSHGDCRSGGSQLRHNPSAECDPCCFCSPSRAKNAEKCSKCSNRTAWIDFHVFKHSQTLNFCCMSNINFIQNHRQQRDFISPQCFLGSIPKCWILNVESHVVINVVAIVATQPNKWAHTWPLLSLSVQGKNISQRNYATRRNFT